MTAEIETFAIGERVSLRDRTFADLDQYIVWQTQGEWLSYDATWESSSEPLTPEQEGKIRTYYIKTI